MPRKAYIADAAAVIDQAAAQNSPGITSITKGSEDGELHICFVPPTGLPIEIQLIALDVGGYPSENTYMITTASLDLPDNVNDALQDIQKYSRGIHIPDLIATISRKLQRLLARESEASDISMEDPESDQESDQEMNDETDHYPETDDEWKDSYGVNEPATGKAYIKPEDAIRIDKRIRLDLRAVKDAGFRVGILNGMKADSVSSIVSISVKVDQLGLSDAALHAWGLEPHQYAVLLLRYRKCYKEFEAVISEPAEHAQVEFKTGVCNKYKPTRYEALAAFGNVACGTGDSSETPVVPDNRTELGATGFSSVFISGSLNSFMEQLVSLLKIRKSTGLGWTGATKWLNNSQSRIDKADSEIPPSYYENDLTSSSNTHLESLLKDHLTDGKPNDLSFPLIATQFFLLYLTRCTEYCLICHEKTQEELQALKPYVCSKPLCLYQYMSLGFGPSLEHELLTQPYVVDLLVSFCYASAYHRKIREYPTGMNLNVPPVTVLAAHSSNPIPRSMSIPGSTIPVQSTDLLDVKLDSNRQEVLFEEGSSCPVRNGEWIALKVDGAGNGALSSGHYQVVDISLYPTVKLSRAGYTPKSSFKKTSDVPVAPATPLTALTPAKLAMYNQNFDEMDSKCKAESIVALLETLPSIKEMRDYLIRQSRYAEPSLRTWKEGMSPAALGLLRWILASNRSCIMQVDRCPGQDEHDATLGKIRLDQRISNIDKSWVQFRFAQGSPDKEQRFLNALREQQGNLNPSYPTLFAWHGSRLYNWHSIIRTGLDFIDVQNGRAYGHGVYHAIDQEISCGYANRRAEMQATWPGSELKISSAMSLNEIVNCPGQFASNSPFLVVQYIDWIQCRYLFVQVEDNPNLNPNSLDANMGANFASSGSNSSVEIFQDPKYTAKSARGKPIGVPLCAVNTSKLFRVDEREETTSPGRKRKRSVDDTSPGEASTSTTNTSTSTRTSVSATASDDEDLKFFLSDNDHQDIDKAKGTSNEGLAMLNSILRTQTDFIPGSLDQSTLPMLPPPSYATPMATKSLNRNLKEVLELQKNSKIHELGWYINPELISNVYQWIVELHSFDPTTPLAHDMKAARVTSVVLEIRFGKGYPNSPPFVRVIRPRFLPFAGGGGGHVTGGGAMCMELLTNSGWSAVSSMEGVLLQVRMAMMNLEPRPARLESKRSSGQRDYGIGEAIDAYRRACHTHGWQIPPDFADFASNGARLAKPPIR
ncbi:uncharacterized protein BP5553_01243 [Venustampulla echinocandica]|uniref:UBC core domain-containing protein n=1 Tax=Venustampulla echinocandica TaxID=2656787 RepID=A0A370U0H5_9HELO|nr:uncharacterized protein BP5553_01243 [Venustampulla echinocandica]RDL41264.1 hypothetical protein BP5553_01243 [Venustampulla echinocandica]